MKPETEMTDQEALAIFRNEKDVDMNLLSQSVYIAAKRLEECQWHDYAKDGSDAYRFGQRVILGVRYEDGSKGSVDGYVNYSKEKGLHLALDPRCKNYLTDNAVIEKWMKYPDYNQQ